MSIGNTSGGERSRQSSDLSGTEQFFIRSFPRFFFLSLGRDVWTNDHMVKDCSCVTLPVMLDMDPCAFLAKNWYPYQLAAGISHPAIPRTIKIIA
jgi:hypothetical protein